MLGERVEERGEVGFSEEDLSRSRLGLLENNRRKAAPTLEARLWGRVSSGWASMIPLGVRTIVGDGTADNLLLAGASLVGRLDAGGPLRPLKLIES